MDNKDRFSPEENKPSSLEALKKRLYRKINPLKQSGDGQRGAHELHEKKYDVSGTWKEENTMPQELPKEYLGFGWIKWFFIGSIVFFFVALVVAAFVFFRGSNVVSPDNIVIDVSGPVSIGGGEELALQISVHNNNNVALELSDLLIEYPSGTRAVGNLEKELPRIRKSLGNISAGQTVNEVVRAVLFGQEQSVEQIKISLEYRVEGSNAIFVKDKTYEIALSSSPVSVSISALKEVSVNQEMSMAIKVDSRSNTALQNLAVQIEYPSGFEFSGATPSPASGQTLWLLGDVPENGSRTITVTGIMRGQDSEKKVFRIAVGTANTSGQQALGVMYSTTFQEITLRRPFMSAEMAVNGSTNEEYIAHAGEDVRVEISWVNNLPVRVTDGSIEVTLSGDIVDESTISVEKGNYDSSRNTISWDKRSYPAFGVIESGKEGRLQFSFKPKSLFGTDKIIYNPEVSMALTIGGNRTSESDVPTKITTSSTRVIKFSSGLQMTSRATHFVGPLSNAGSLPPVAEKETTYTVVWTVLNSSNNLSSAEVRATLPSYVRWKGMTTPGENISFDPASGEVLWSLGKVDAGVGFSSKAREVAFQVGLFPSVNQVGQTPDILSEAAFSANDDFTFVPVGITARPVSTRLSTDPGFKSGDEVVVAK
ncbi:MAG: hypothetical protein HZC04_01595 [Candidatus Lloydbacteria bacterium]|nr:hypothetical protein [Candidatus Lloydbacteria bacterium]